MYAYRDQDGEVWLCLDRHPRLQRFRDENTDEFMPPCPPVCADCGSLEVQETPDPDAEDRCPDCSDLRHCPYCGEFLMPSERHPECETALLEEGGAMNTKQKAVRRADGYVEVDLGECPVGFVEKLGDVWKLTRATAKYYTVPVREFAELPDAVRHVVGLASSKDTCKL